MMLDVKRTVVLGLIVMAGVAYATPLLAQEAGAGGADLGSLAGADSGSAGEADAGAGGAPLVGGKGGNGGTAGKPAVIGGTTSYELLEDNSGHACSIGHSSGTSHLGVIVGVTVALLSARRRRRQNAL